MIYTTDQLEEDFRSDVFDKADRDDAGNVRDVLWSPEDVLRYINEACHRLASDTLALRRVIELDFAAGTPVVKTPLTEILDVLTAYFAVPGFGRQRALRQFDIDDGLAGDDYGQTYYAVPDLTAEGMPTHFTRDYDNFGIRLWKIPHVAGKLVLNAIVLPKQLYAGMPIPFPQPIDRHLLLLWMKKLAYAKQDADTIDLARSRDFEREYERRAALRRSEIDRLRRNNGIMQPA